MVHDTWDFVLQIGLQGRLEQYFDLPINCGVVDPGDVDEGVGITNASMTSAEIEIM